MLVQCAFVKKKKLSLPHPPNIPKALLDQMKSAGLVEGSTTNMGGVVAQELKFSPQAAEFVVKFFRAVH